VHAWRQATRGRPRWRSATANAVRLEKQARKAARKQAAADVAAPAAERSSPHEASQPLANQPAVDAATQAFGDLARTDEKKQEAPMSTEPVQEGRGDGDE
jgi:hypothetical protein